MKCIMGGCEKDAEAGKDLCIDHKHWKQSKMFGEKVETVVCENCHERTPKGRQCIRCGHLNGAIKL